VSDDKIVLTRRNALKCMAMRGRHTVRAGGGVFAPLDLAMAADDKLGTHGSASRCSLQISDTTSASIKTRIRCQWHPHRDH